MYVHHQLLYGYVGNFINMMILSYPLVLVYVVLPSLPPFKANHALLSGHPRRAIVSSKMELEELDTSPGDLSGISCLGWDGWNTRFKSLSVLP